MNIEGVNICHVRKQDFTPKCEEHWRVEFILNDGSSWTLLKGTKSEVIEYAEEFCRVVGFDLTLHGEPWVVPGTKE
jgi:hypothetical protein